MKLDKKNFNETPFMYKNIPLKLITKRGYPNDAKALRYTLNDTNQNVWIPTKHVNQYGELKPDQNIDYLFKKSYRQLLLSGIDKIGDFIDNDFRIIVAGGREFSDFALLERKLDKILGKVNRPVTIVSGGAWGADYYGELYAQKKGYNLVIMPADWRGPMKKRAGLIRNEEMSRIAHALVAFWDGSSTGTAHMITQATRMNLQSRVIRYDQY